MTVDIGDPSPQGGSSVEPLPPTGPSTASASSDRKSEGPGQPPAAAAPPSKRPGRAARRRAHRAASGRRLFAFDRALGVRFVAGADEAGRGCLAGPLVAAAVLFDMDLLRPADIRALSALNDSKLHTPASRAELYPVILRLASKISVVSRCAPGIDERGLHVTNLSAL